MPAYFLDRNTVGENLQTRTSLTFSIEVDYFLETSCHLRKIVVGKCVLVFQNAEKANSSSSIRICKHELPAITPVTKPSAVSERRVTVVVVTVLNSFSASTITCFLNKLRATDIDTLYSLTIARKQ